MSKETKLEELKPVEAEELDECVNCEDCDCEVVEEETVVEAAPVADEPKPTVQVVKSYIAEEGDSYASIAAKFAPKDMSKHAFAIHLTILNKNKPVVAGAEIKVN